MWHTRKLPKDKRIVVDGKGGCMHDVRRVSLKWDTNPRLGSESYLTRRIFQTIIELLSPWCFLYLCGYGLYPSSKWYEIPLALSSIDKLSAERKSLFRGTLKRAVLLVKTATRTRTLFNLYRLSLSGTTCW